jgi:hypothetical protein
MRDQSIAETSTLTTHNTHNRQPSLPLVGFEPKISAGERAKTYALDRAATGTGNALLLLLKNIIITNTQLMHNINFIYIIIKALPSKAIRNKMWH